ncbi:GSCOCG00011677001-RA-CDS, partial [Cotesia congregata]
KFHTYSLKNEKKKTLVIKGLHEETNPGDIQAELMEIGIEAKQVSLMKGTNYPIFIVAVTVDTLLKHVKQKARLLCNTKVTWENYETKRRASQCHRCQEWGHATINCFAEPACLKCGEAHLTKDCVKSKDTPAKCVNCAGDHPANATICKSY